MGSALVYAGQCAVRIPLPRAFLLQHLHVLRHHLLTHTRLVRPPRRLHDRHVSWTHSVFPLRVPLHARRWRERVSRWRDARSRPALTIRHDHGHGPGHQQRGQLAPPLLHELRRRRLLQRHFHQLGRIRTVCTYHSWRDDPFACIHALAQHDLAWSWTAFINCGSQSR